MTVQTLAPQMVAARIGDGAGLRARIAPLIAGLAETVSLAGPARPEAHPRAVHGRGDRLGADLHC